MQSFESKVSEEVNSLARDIRKNSKKLGIVAEGLLGPVPVGKKFSVYKVETPMKTYLIEAREGAYPADIQRVIELRENKTFDELMIPYLKPEDIKEF